MPPCKVESTEKHTPCRICASDLPLRVEMFESSFCKNETSNRESFFDCRLPVFFFRIRFHSVAFA
ncbi:hypothetical protein JCM15519_37770 [Fundidesulfovibrio butyratiphilus]